ncbi:DUF5672 family protein [Pedobacter sp. AW31-3R]|uniref:DUF5672 family protein n=1 Tax=Pedobacter sp. AW31-3R TaxID=3445781 RepID=UPI003FA13865
MNNKVCKVVIPVYKEDQSFFEQLSMDQCFRVLRDHDICFVVPERLEDFIVRNKYILSGEASYTTFDNSFFSGIPAYNRLMKSSVFYQAFLDYDFILLYQLDAFVFKDELKYWCALNLDNIGAPLFEGHELAVTNSPIVGQGNGGFCLRKVKSCYEITRTWRRLHYKRKFADQHPSLIKRIYRYIKHDLIFNYSRYPFQPIMNEDLFWAEVVPVVFPDFVNADPLTAIGFSFEVNPQVLFEMNNERLPFGCHAWRRYNPDFWEKYIEDGGYGR